MPFRLVGSHLIAVLWVASVVCSAYARPVPLPASVAADNPAPPAGANSTPPPAAPDASPQAKKASDAANKLEAAVATSGSLIDSAAKYQQSISDITGPTSKPNQSVSDSLQNLQASATAIQQNNLIGALTAAKGTLASAESARKDACDSLGQASTNQPEVTDALAKCKKAQSDASDTSSKLDSAVADLQRTLGSIGPYMASQFDNLADKLKPFVDKYLVAAPGGTSPSGKPDVAVVLQVLPKGLPALKQVLESETEYKLAWNNMKAVVQAAISSSAASKPQTGSSGGATPSDAGGGAAKSPQDADAELQKLQGTVDNIEKGLADWFAIISAKLQGDAQALNGKIAGVETDPAKNSADALGDVRDKTETLATVQSVVDAWPPLVGFLVDGQPSGFSLSTTKKNYEDLQKWTNELRASISRVHDALAGDFKDFVTDQVTLYYFTDVNRLMYALNERFQTLGGVSDAQAKAAEQRTILTKAELDLADAQATVNRYQKEAQDLEEQQRQVQLKLQDLSLNPNPSISSKSYQDQTQKQSEDLQNQSDSLATKLSAARQSLSDAQTAVSRERRTMLLAAQAESDAFALARDNAPFMVAFADASSPDPAKRVTLYAFNDSKTIFMRGKPDDVKEVKIIIDKFDQPAPQARLTLWTFELNAEANQKANKGAAERLNRSMEIVDEELGDTRALENTVLTLFRYLINTKVKEAAEKQSDPTCQVGCTKADNEKFKRLAFYDPAVLYELHFDRERVATGVTADDLDALRTAIPDPAGTTTLGEAIFTLSLAPTETRRAIRRSFESSIKASLRALPLSPKLDKCAWLAEAEGCPDSVVRPQTESIAAEQYLLPLTWHALGVWEQDSSPGFTSAQVEITNALRTYSSEDLKEHKRLRDLNRLNGMEAKLSGWYDELSKLDDVDTQLQKEMIDLKGKGVSRLPLKDKKRLNSLQSLPKPTAAEKAEREQLEQDAAKLLSPSEQATYQKDSVKALEVQARRNTISKDSVPLLNQLQAMGVDVGDLVSRAQAASSPAERNAAVDEGISVVKAAFDALNLKQASTPQGQARQAAADEMLKEMIIAVEDDLSRLFIQPMVRGLRKRLISETGVNVGILQRESLLATNRGKARVDPRASAQLAVGEEEDILSGVQQLAQLYGAIQSGGALAAFGALQKQPREPQPEIYALTTGSRFEVTPIFDPSGQALRFKFDYVGTSHVQDPNGTTNPQLPQIERHTVNTEVQLTNLETREISRFESNARLGLPVRYWGGVPILKDIPYVRPWVPLVGWFVRKAGTNAAAQQSVIFGQTTIYPTIKAIVDLMQGPETESDTAAAAKPAAPMPQTTPQPGSPAPKGDN